MGTLTSAAETAPGEKSQFDWSDCSAGARDWGLGARNCGARAVAPLEPASPLVVHHWWFTTSIERHHALVEGASPVATPS